MITPAPAAQGDAPVRKAAWAFSLGGKNVCRGRLVLASLRLTVFAGFVGRWLARARAAVRGWCRESVCVCV